MWPSHRQQALKRKHTKSRASRQIVSSERRRERLLRARDISRENLERESEREGEGVSRHRERERDSLETDRERERERVWKHRERESGDGERERPTEKSQEREGGSERRSVERESSLCVCGSSILILNSAAVSISPMALNAYTQTLLHTILHNT